MDRLTVIGGIPLRGTVRVHGAKNATLPILAATVLAGGPCQITDVPNLRDVTAMVKILELLGAKVQRPKINTLLVDTGALTRDEICEELMRETRSSIFLMGALLGRLGKVKVPYPGGCNIGPRPIDLHLKGLRAMGVTIEEKNGYVCAQTNQLQGADIHLDFPSVGATENIIMAATKAKGTTIIRNAAKEPEVVDLQNCLNRMGAKIRGAGTDTIKIDGVSELAGVNYAVIPDRIETGTFMVAAAVTGGEVVIENTIFAHVEPVAAKLREAGVEVFDEEKGILVKGHGVLKGVDIKTLPYPGYPTDMQPQTMAMLTVAQGTSVIIENIFPSRFKHVDELRRMGAQIKTEGRAAVIRGCAGLSGARVEAPDLRAGMALILAGLMAEGETTIDHIYHVDRGYDGIERKLEALGAKIWRTSVGEDGG